MVNLFFDIIPLDIQNLIYEFRLSHLLAKNYYRRIAKKVALAHFVLKLQKMHPTPPGIVLYYDPDDYKTRYIIERCCQVITKYDDKVWWISQLIIPVEYGLIIFGNTYETASENYLRTLRAYNKLIEIFQRAKPTAFFI